VGLKVKKNKYIDDSNDNFDQNHDLKDNQDKNMNNLGFKKNNQDYTDKGNRLRYNNGKDDKDQTNEQIFKKNGISKHNSNGDNAKSFANHEESDDDQDGDMKNWGDGDSRKHQQAHSFGNSYSDNDQNDLDKNNIDSEKRGSFSQRKANTGFDKASKDKKGRNDSVDYQNQNKNMKKRYRDQNSNRGNKNRNIKKIQAARNAFLNKKRDQANAIKMSQAQMMKEKKARQLKHQNEGLRKGAARSKKIIRDVDHNKN